MTGLWPENHSFEAFRRAFPITDENLYQELFFYFRDRVQVKREEPAIRNLEKIFKATFKLTSKKGFHAMSLRDLSQETQISMGGLYKYIKGKDDLAYMIEEFASHCLIDHNEVFLAQAKSDEEKRDLLIRTFTYIIELFQPWFFFMFMEAKNMSAENKTKAKEVERRSVRIIMGILEPFHTKNKVDSNLVLTASTLLATIESRYLKHWFYKENGTNIDAYAEHCVALAKKLL